MRDGYWPYPDAGYTAADYATAVKAILNSPYKAFDEELLVDLLSSKQQALDAMVQANLLTLRHYSPWATDIDAAAFGPDLHSTVVTAPTPLHLYLMQEKRSTLLAPLAIQQVGPLLRQVTCPKSLEGICRLLLKFSPSSGQFSSA